jgi:hypothetical protein
VDEPEEFSPDGVFPLEVGRMQVQLSSARMIATY